MKIITTACDTQLDEHCFICPGLGNFGDRYFGTDPVASASDNEELLNGYAEQLSSQSCTPSSPIISNHSTPRMNHVSPHRDHSPAAVLKPAECEDVFSTI